MKYIKIIGLILAGWIIVSLLLGGPIIFGVVSCHGKINEVLYNCVAVPAMIFIAPIYPVMFFSKSVYDYMGWWAAKGDPSIPNPSHEEFKEDILKVFA